MSTFVTQKKDDLTSGTRRSPMATQERLLCFICSFYISLKLLNLITLGEIPRPWVTYVLCQELIGFFVNLPMAEARDFHCSSHVVENLGKKTIPSDHAAVRFVIQKPSKRGHQSKRIPSWMSKHPIFPYCSNFMTTTDSLMTRFVRWQNLKTFCIKPKKITHRELLKQTPACIGEKLLLTSTALRAYRNRHLGTLMRCCEAWKPIEDCFDILSFECIDFQNSARFFACLTRENFQARETEVSTLPWTQTEKDIDLA